MMDPSKSAVAASKVPAEFHEMWCDDRERQGAAFHAVVTVIAEPVDWAYEVWGEVLAQLTDRNNRNRSIAAQVMSHLAKSDPEGRLLRDFPALFDVVNDERFVTARHALQSLWKVGCVSEAHRRMLVEALAQRFSMCVTHKNCTLIRYDILQCLRTLYDAVQEPDIPPRAMALIELETDLNYTKKYLTLWQKF